MAARARLWPSTRQKRNPQGLPRLQEGRKVLELDEGLRLEKQTYSTCHPEDLPLEPFRTLRDMKLHDSSFALHAWREDAFAHRLCFHSVHSGTVSGNPAHRSSARNAALGLLLTTAFGPMY